MVQFEPEPARPLRGDEQIAGTDLTVMDFWRWSTSDLRDNTTRGVYVEFLVARALDDPNPVRRGWDNFDVTTPEGVRVEVKSAAYLQAWRQARHSTIRFSGLTGLTWDDVEGWGAKAGIRCDVFVLVIQTATTHDQLDLLDTSQLDFYVLPATALPAETTRSVGLAFVREHSLGPLRLADLRDAVRLAAPAPEPAPQSA